MKLWHIGAGILAIVVLIVLMMSITVVPAGHAGVHVLLGDASDTEMGPGWHFKHPLASVKKYSTKTQEYTMTFTADEGAKSGDDSLAVLTIEGLEIGIDVTIWFHIEKDNASVIYKTIEGDYKKTLIRTYTRGIVRDVVKDYSVHNVYSHNRTEIEQQIKQGLEAKVGFRGIVLEDVVIRHIELPHDLKQHIEDKLNAEQEALKWEWYVEKEMKEKERKLVEAEGIAQANEIIAGSLTDSYLKWYWLENLDSHNSVIYVVDGNMPFIFEAPS